MTDETPGAPRRPDPDAFEREMTTDLDDRTDDRPRGMPLHTRILLGLVLGAVTGLIASAALGPEHPALAWTVRHLAQPIGGLFVRLLLMVVIPLVFSALVVGVAGVGDIRKLGRVGLKSLGYTLVVSAISVVIGLGLANTIRPGDRVSAQTAAALEARYGEQAQARVEAADIGEDGGAKKAPLTEAVETLIPANPVAAMAGDTPNLLHLMFFALALGVAATLLKAAVVAPFLRVMDAIFEISVKLIEIIMKMAPYAVFALLFANTAGFGLDLLGTLGWFVVTVLLGLSLQMFGVYSISLILLSLTPSLLVFYLLFCIARMNWAGPFAGDYHRNYLIWLFYHMPVAPGLGPDGKQYTHESEIDDLAAVVAAVPVHRRTPGKRSAHGGGRHSALGLHTRQLRYFGQQLSSPHQVRSRTQPQPPQRHLLIGGTGGSGAARKTANNSASSGPSRK